MTDNRTSLCKRVKQIRDQLEIVTRHATLHDPRVVKLSEELDRLILQFYKK